MMTIMMVTLRFHYIPSSVFPLGACPLAVVIIRREVQPMCLHMLRHINVYLRWNFNMKEMKRPSFIAKTSSHCLN